MNNNIAAIGHNQPPGAIELAEPTIEALRQCLKDFPVIANEDEARECKAILDRSSAAFKGIEDERRSKTDPLNLQIKEINATYHKWHNTDSKRFGIWDKLVDTLRSRLSNWAWKEEAKRKAAAEAARATKEEAERLAREAEQREREAAADAAQGICDVDIAAATEEADAAFSAFQRADRISQRALRNTKVRIGGGFGKVSTLRNKEILIVTDWKAAISDIAAEADGLPAVIADAILTAARTYRKVCGGLPDGISRTTERSL